MRTSILAAGLFTALACTSIAQAQTPAPAAAPTAPAVGGFTDDELKAFGGAMTEVSKLSAEYSPKMVGADGPTKISVQKEMIAKMGAAVSASGLTPQKYNEISAAVSKDPALRQHLTEVLNGPPAA
ncbi:DUF4168 domain-containing protein [Phenylobacterium sp.]|uniref:DUF4168 domain-containing protein n=1 Tax=Phenylobacterium sp. TaxID=1871053 RepID=UPI002733AF48|nr:DUF4168 domain-containing protein [Phenylobacterium sp.]MDP3854122.1 DUF4168 domain-containing protein [Phenylobacterium sp.]